MPKKIFKGKVVSTKMQKTVVVVVDMPKMHPIYKKAVKYTKRFKARDELGVKLGDTVIIEESKPFSKEVTWKVLEVVEATEGKK
jgi:small subunit ribosomal protein S17